MPTQPAALPTFPASSFSHTATLSPLQVTQLLQKMNMAQYQDRFAQSAVDGSILLDIDAYVLETELGVSNKLDRVKLMNIIEGKRSAKSVLDGEYNYVALEMKS